MKARLAWIGVLRHGQSTGNVAREKAEATGAEVIDINLRDADVPLTELGREQAGAAGRWLAHRPPEVVISSPYVRAVQTARLALTGATLPGEPRLDERLRDRELGVLDLLTRRGVERRRPEELRRKRRLGKFYYRPPGGESWADVVLRLRSLLADLHAEYAGGRVLLVAHDMTVFALRYLLEDIPETELLGLARRHQVPNGSITGWEPGPDGHYRLAHQETGHLEARGTTPTRHHDAVHLG